MCIAMGLILLPTDAFASGKGSGLAKGLDKKAASTTAVTTPSTPTGTIAASTASGTTGGSDHSAGNAGTFGNPTQPQPTTQNEVPGGPGANNQTNNPYGSTRNGSPSLNGNGKGNATGKPCAGCVGRADNKNPKGQAPGGSDNNAGYECDRNHGIGRSNPAHTGCTTSTTGSTSTTSTTLKHHGSTTTSTTATTQPKSSGSTSTTTVCSSGTSGSTGSGSAGSSCGTTITPAIGAPGHGSSTTVAPATPAKASKAKGSLAFTGANLGIEFLAGGMAMGAGALLLGTTRRRRPAATEDDSVSDGEQ